ncbi:MAG: type II secretion system protein [Caldiserica bacterium]|nr:type II secretion system protein [Caldisericota bacterium]
MKSGFTLLEVLISLAIVGILIVVILESENLNLKVRENSSLYTSLLLSGNDLLSRVLSGEKISSLQGEEGWEVEEEKADYGEKVEMKVGKPSGPWLILHTYVEKGTDYKF